MAVEIMRKDLTPAQVRLAAGKTKDARAARRMLAIALVLEGMDRKTSAETCGMAGRRCATGCTATTPRGCRG